MNHTNVYKSKLIAIILWFFLGGLGIHEFYLGNPKKAFIFIGLIVFAILSVIFRFYLGGLLLLANSVLVYVDLFLIIFDKNMDFGWSVHEL